MTKREKAIYCIGLAVRNVDYAAETAVAFGLDPAYVDGVAQEIVVPEVRAALDRYRDCSR